jgi:hypothetical protein
VRPLASTCATRVGLGATVSVDLCHRSGLEYMSHGFRTQGTIAARAGLKVRPESTCVPGPWILDPRYGARVHGAPAVSALDQETYRGGTRGSRLCGEGRDRETENSKVCTRTWDTRFIQVRVAKVASPTSCLGYQVWRPALGVGLRSGARLGTRPSFI